MIEKYCEHIISFHWQEFKPILLSYNTESQIVRQLPLESIDFTLSEHKSCVGRMDGNLYRPCPQQARLSKNITCLMCNPPNIPVLDCVFEPRCNGERCQFPAFCTRPHVVYLAIYGNLIKVGMTSEKRFAERIVEQGADSAAAIFRCSNRLEARNLEKEISTRFKIPQEIRPQKLMRQWVSPPSTEQMKNVYHTYLHKIELWQNTLGNELRVFDEYPIVARPRSPPKLMKSAGRHQGNILGIKGRFLVYRTPKGSAALDLSDIVGREAKIVISDDSRLKETLNIQ